MERFTMSLEDKLAEEFDAFIQKKGYSNRSEAMRDLIRSALEKEQLKQAASGHCIAALSYVYNHHESELASRVTSTHHHHHDLTLSTMHVHMDHDNCLETVILQGHVGEVQEFADSILAVRGVRHGHLHMIATDEETTTHHDHKHGHDRSHTHLKPRT